MTIIPPARLTRPAILLALLALLSACARPVPPTATAEPGPLLAIGSATLDRSELPRYESLELTVDLQADYANPYDARQVALDGTFTAPDGTAMTVPGFWDGVDAWRLRFTPWLEGAWSYSLTVQDRYGTSLPAEGVFQVTASDLHGWLQVGSQVDPAWSGRYLVHHDGTPFYGVGLCEALNILIDGFDVEDGVGLFNSMQAAGENFVVWWPQYSNPILTSYDEYSSSSAALIDMVVADAQKKGIHLVFTVWDHPSLRDETHSWGRGKWSLNGFNQLTGIDGFFTDAEAWAWQENLYRYSIARWGYSPAIGMWQTVTEINGTNAYGQTNPWHERLNAYFVENDPYRHPTTASMSGDTDWPEGFAAMDMPQTHVYALEDPVEAAETIAHWTRVMWQHEAKPNWIGEFGVTDGSVYPELFHNSIWAALASGAALTPAEWNSGGAFGRLTPAMQADLQRLATFVDGLPLAAWDPQPLTIATSEPGLRAWGLGGQGGALLWVQDFSLQGEPIATIRSSQPVRSGVSVTIDGLPAGEYLLRPYDTWQGLFLDPIPVTVPSGQAFEVVLPDFSADMAFLLEQP
jgi:hypothetical protein